MSTSFMEAKPNGRSVDAVRGMGSPPVRRLKPWPHTHASATLPNARTPFAAQHPARPEMAPGVMHSLLDASPDCIKLVDLDGTLRFINRNGQCALEIDDPGAVAGARWPDLWPEDTRDLVMASVEAAGRGEPQRFEAFALTAKGSPRWWDVSVSPVLDDEGKPERLLSISRDITERVRQQEEIMEHDRRLRELATGQARTLEEKEQLLRDKTLLMQEVDHRVKNSLAMITSLLSVQGRMVEDVPAKEALERASIRVQAIASVHERLYKQGSEGQLDLADYLQGLCGDLDRTAKGLNVSIQTDIGAVAPKRPDEAVALGLVTTELVTNAIRHADPGEDGCTIHVRMRPRPGGEELIVEDDGCGLPEGFDPELSKGLGMRVIRGNVARLNGTLSIETPHCGGTRFVVRI